MDIGIELWKISWVWDTRLLAKSYTYSVGTATDANPTETVTVADSDGDWVTFAASTRALKRVNTLAIYAEGNFYNGHYPALERFTIIILRVEGTPNPQDPIKAGVNVILVPVSIFIRTHLHALLESGAQANPPLELGNKSASKIAAEFHGIDAASETVSQHVEGLIVKGLKEDENGNQDYVTPAEALAILNYVLCNETGDLTYSAYLCDEVGMVEHLGLAEDILDLVPLDAESMKNDPLGAMPKGFWDWLGSIFLNALKFILLIALAPILLTIVLVAALIYIGIALLGPIFAAIVLAAIKVIIIIFVFIMFALTLLSALISFLIIALVISLIAVITQQYIQWGFLYIEFNLWNIPGRYELRVEWEPNDFLKISVPVLVTEITLAGNLLSRSVDRMGLGPAEDTENVTPQELIALEPASPILDPMRGTSTTTFTFKISYTGPDDTPPDVNLYLLYESSGQVYSLPYDMAQEDPEDTIYSDGCIFKKEILGNDLSPCSDSFSYYIEAVYGDQHIKYPEEGYRDGPFMGEIVLLPPDSGEVLNPTSGDTETTFTYRIKYVGPNGIDPTVTLHFHYINAEGFPDVETIIMGKESADETYSDGCIYTFDKGPLGGGEYSYHIEAVAVDLEPPFYDTARYPAIGVKAGPSVTEINLLEVAHNTAISMYLLAWGAFSAVSAFIFSGFPNCAVLAYVGLGIGIFSLITSLIGAVSISPDPIHKAIGSLINAFLCLLIWIFLFHAFTERSLTKADAIDLKNSLGYIIMGILLGIIGMIPLAIRPLMKSETLTLIDTILRVTASVVYVLIGVYYAARIATAVLSGSAKAFGNSLPKTKPFQKTCFKAFIWLYLAFFIIYFVMFFIYMAMALTT